MDGTVRGRIRGNRTGSIGTDELVPRDRDRRTKASFVRSFVFVTRGRRNWSSFDRTSRLILLGMVVEKWREML